MAADIIFAEHTPDGIWQAKREEQPAKKLSLCAAALLLLWFAYIMAFCAYVIDHNFGHIIFWRLTELNLLN